MKIDLRQRLFASSLTDGETSVNDADLELINNLKQNGPLRPLTADQIFVRRMIILGEEPTSKMSVHLQGKKGNKEYTVLSELAATLPGSPMLEGHRMDKAGWGRIFNAEVLQNVTGYQGNVLKISYYFLKADNGEQRAARIDGGIDAEGSISYRFKKAHCSICDAELMVGSFMGMNFTRMKCNHQLGQSYDGVTCYWYPEAPQAMEVSTVFRGAYGKTRSMLSLEQLPKNEAELCATYADADEDERIGLALADAIITEASLAEMPVMSEATLSEKTEPAEPITPEGETHNDDGKSVLRNDEPTSGTDGKNGDEGNGSQSPAAENADGRHNGDQSGNGTADGGSVGTTEKNNPPTPESESKAEKQPEQNTETAGKYLVCANPDCGYWEDNTDNVKESNKVCPKCSGNLVVKDEKPAEKKADTPAKNSFLVCKDCGYSVDKETAVELTITECHECGIELTESETALDEQIIAKMHIEMMKIGELIGPVKPAKAGASNNEFFDINGFRNLPGTYYVEPKYDGVYMELHKKDGKAKLLTDSGADQTVKFPNVIAEAEKMRADNFVLMGEVVKYRGRQRGTHTDVTSYMNSSGPYEDYHFRFKPFDMAYSNGQDIRSKPLDERRKLLDTEIQRTAHIHPTKYNVVKGGLKLVRAIEAMSTREGAMIKDANMTLDQAGREKIYKWKRHFEIDAKVVAVKEKSGGGYVYSCEVGHGTDAHKIGDTYTTSIKAKYGDILQVTVDHVTYNEATKQYSWYAPKVLSLRDDKTEPDPLSTVYKIAEIKNPGIRAKNGIILSDVIALLEKAEFGFDLYVCGGLVSKGRTEHDIDLLTVQELSETEKAQIVDVLGEDYAPYADFIVNENGPDSTHVKFAAKDGKLTPQAKYAKRFVIQRHAWGKAEHFDLRFGNPDGTKMWGFTCFKEPTKVAGGPKVRCEEKQYHEVRWLDFDGEIKPGNPGNPTKNLTATMKILDKGKYDFVKRTKNFLEVVLHGKEWNGRYVFRQIEVKAAGNSLAADDEAKSKGKIWVMWKPQDQTVGKATNSVEYVVRDGVLFYWEGTTVDPESGLN